MHLFAASGNATLACPFGTVEFGVHFGLSALVGAFGLVFGLASSARFTATGLRGQYAFSIGNRRKKIHSYPYV